MATNGSAALALTGASLELALSNKERLGLLKDTICQELTTPEFEVFVEVCNRRRLDPFARQIHAVKRKDGDGHKVTHQTGIDGFRLIAERTGKYDGQLGPFWCGKDGEWKDVWLGDGPPHAAKVGVLRAGFKEPIWAVARYAAYVQTKILWGKVKGEILGREPTEIWQKMSDGQTAKCAEALALRRAFPEELSGLYSEDEIAEPAAMGRAGDPVVVATTLHAETATPKPVRMAPTKALDAELLEVDAKPRSNDELSAELAATFRSMMTKDERARAHKLWVEERANLEPALVASLQKIWDDRIADLVELGKRTKAAPVPPPTPTPEGVTYSQSWRDAEAAERAAIQAADEIPFR